MQEGGRVNEVLVRVSPRSRCMFMFVSPGLYIRSHKMCHICCRKQSLAIPSIKMDNLEGSRGKFPTFRVISVSVFASSSLIPCLPAPPPVQFVIPLMLVFIVARSVGNKINEGIYDTQISIKKMPFLEQVSNGGALHNTHTHTHTNHKDCAGCIILHRSFAFIRRRPCMVARGN